MMKNKSIQKFQSIVWVLMVVACCMMPSSLSAIENVSVGIGKMEGYTTYSIGGDFSSSAGSGNLWTISELAFPLYVPVLNVSLLYTVSDYEYLSLEISKPMSGYAGKMKDSDWGYYCLQNSEDCFDYNLYSNSSLDIYSESDAELKNSGIVDFRFMYMVGENFYLGAGYKYEYFEYEVSNLDQWYPSSQAYFGQPEPHVTVKGKVLDYAVAYQIPYFCFQYNYVFSDVYAIDFNLGHSPMVKSNDYDNHILRSKEGYGTGKGTATFYRLSVQYEVKEAVRLLLDLHNLKINTQGRQEQYLDGVWLANLDQEMTSEQQTVMLQLEVSF